MIEFHSICYFPNDLGLILYLSIPLHLTQFPYDNGPLLTRTHYDGICVKLYFTNFQSMFLQKAYHIVGELGIFSNLIIIQRYVPYSYILVLITSRRYPISIGCPSNAIHFLAMLFYFIQQLHLKVLRRE